MESVSGLDDLLAAWRLDAGAAVMQFDSPHYACSGKAFLIQTTAGERYVLKEKISAEKLAQECALLLALEAHGVPVAAPLPAVAGTYYARQGDRYYCLAPYLAGEVIVDHYAAGAEERARTFGEAIASLHAGLRQCAHLADLPVMDLVRDARWAGAKVLETCRAGHAEELRRILEALYEGLAECCPDLPIQPIHRDAHPANMLFRDGKLTGWLDFELAVRGPRLFDLGYCATSLLMDGFDDPVKRPRWFNLVAALVQGYAAQDPLPPAERAALWHVMLAIEAIFAAYYQEIGNETGAAKNLEALLWTLASRERVLAATEPDGT